MSKLLSRKVLVPTGIIIVVLVILFMLPIPKVVSPEFSIAGSRGSPAAGLATPAARVS